MEKSKFCRFLKYFFQSSKFKIKCDKIRATHVIKYKKQIKEVKMQRKNGCTICADKEKEILTIVLNGDIDHHGAVGVRTEIDGAIGTYRPKKTVLCLSGIDFMDSSGIGLIMGRYAKMKAIGGELVIYEPNERVMKIFKMAGLEKIVRIEKESEVD